MKDESTLAFLARMILQALLPENLRRFKPEDRDRFTRIVDGDEDPGQEDEALKAWRKAEGQ
jgi:hypothetical protein